MRNFIFVIVFFCVYKSSAINIWLTRVNRKQILHFEMDRIMAKKTWELENMIEAIEAVPECDKIFRFDAQNQQEIRSSKPWEQDPHYFKDVKISALALLKMVMHARSGGSIEIMGLMLGKIDGTSMIVMDVFALPVEGTETQVNAQAQAYEYMTQYIESAKEVGKSGNDLEGD